MSSSDDILTGVYYKAGILGRDLPQTSLHKEYLLPKIFSPIMFKLIASVRAILYVNLSTKNRNPLCDVNVAMRFFLHHVWCIVILSLIQTIPKRKSPLTGKMTCADVAPMLLPLKTIWGTLHIRKMTLPL